MLKVHWIRTLALIVAVAALLGIPGKSGAAPTAPYVSLYCISLGHQRLECHVAAYGGTAPYSYQWTPPKTPAGSSTGGEGQEVIAIIPCARAYANQTVYVTATDSIGATGSASTTCYCGDAQ